MAPEANPQPHVAAAPAVRPYSDAYEKLVGDGIDGSAERPFDLVGIIAYALYKKGKIEFIVDGNRAPDAPEVKRYYEILTPTQITALRDSAEGILNSYADNLQQAFAANTRDATVNSELLRNIKSEFDGVRHHITQRTTSGSAIVSGVIASVVFGLLLTVAAVLQGQNPLSVLWSPKTKTDAPAAAPPAPPGTAGSASGAKS